MFCMNCGQKLPDAAKFCFNCGSKVPEIVPESALDTKDEFPEEHWSDEEKLAFAEEILNSDYKVVRRYCEGKKILALDLSTESDASEGALYLIDYDRDTILDAFRKYFENFHKDGGKRTGEGKDIGYIGHILGPGRGMMGKILLRQDIFRRKQIKKKGGRYPWELGDDELYKIYCGEVYKLNLEVSENDVSASEMKLDGEVRSYENQSSEYAKIKEWSSTKDESGMSGCVVLFYDDKTVSVMKGVIDNPFGMNACPFFLYQNWETQDLSEVTQASNLGFKIAQMSKMNLIHIQYGRIIDFSMLQIAIFERTLNKKTQYFIRTANKRKNPSSVEINDCKYYEFTDGEMKEIDFEQLKKYQKSEHKVRFMTGLLKYPHENIF